MQPVRQQTVSKSGTQTLTHKGENEKGCKNEDNLNGLQVATRTREDGRNTPHTRQKKVTTRVLQQGYRGGQKGCEKEKGTLNPPPVGNDNISHNAG